MADTDTNALAPGLDLPRPADSNWRRQQPLGLSPPPNWGKDQEGNDAAHSTVKVTNTARDQRHVVIDRYYVGHELEPGETKELEMLNADIESFARQRRPGRRGPNGQLFQSHPIVIAGTEERAARREK